MVLSTSRDQRGSGWGNQGYKVTFISRGPLARSLARARALSLSLSNSGLPRCLRMRTKGLCAPCALRVRLMRGLLIEGGGTHEDARATSVATLACVCMCYVCVFVSLCVCHLQL